MVVWLLREIETNVEGSGCFFYGTPSEFAWWDLSKP
jgi:hypothetical protein